ncbi:MAG: hypothetical protein GY870_11620 [archaeon]|nr:hypothetical protein [archaeon]
MFAFINNGEDLKEQRYGPIEKRDELIEFIKINRNKTEILVEGLDGEIVFLSQKGNNIISRLENIGIDMSGILGKKVKNINFFKSKAKNS